MITSSKYPIGVRVRKTRGAQWQGIVVGHYSTSLTPDGVAVESEREPGSVQIYPVTALEEIGLHTPSLDPYFIWEQAYDAAVLDMERRSAPPGPCGPVDPTPNPYDTERVRVKLIDTHPELPQLPEGYFFRIWQSERAYIGEIVNVQIRKRQTGWYRASSQSVQFQSWHLDSQTMKVEGKSDGRLVNSREAAIWCAYKAVEELGREMENQLGDLAGDHPA